MHSHVPVSVMVPSTTIAEQRTQRPQKRVQGQSLTLMPSLSPDPRNQDPSSFLVGTPIKATSVPIPVHPPRGQPVSLVQSRTHPADVQGHDPCSHHLDILNNVETRSPINYTPVPERVLTFRGHRVCM